MQRPARDLRLDVLRGAMQMIIFVSHAHGTLLGWVIPAAWGLSDSSEQFVFLSGFGLGSVFALKAARGGWGAAARDLLARTRRLYLTHLVVFFMFGAMVLWAAMALRLPDEVADTGWAWFAAAPARAVPGALSLLYQPAFMGILPVFVWCMLLLPGFMWLLARFGGAALVLSAALYAVVQATGFAPPALGGTGIAFNPFAWQVLFLLGAWCGRRALLHGRVLAPRRWMDVAAVAILAFGVWYRLVVDYAVLPGPALDAMAFVGKEDLALPRLLHALALAWLLARLLPRHARWMEARLPAALAAAGRHSLNVFCVGLFLAWWAAMAFRLLDVRWYGDLAMIAAGIALLLAWGLAAERRRQPAPATTRPAQEMPPIR